MASEESVVDPSERSDRVADEEPPVLGETCIVVGYDAWTEAVLDELQQLATDVTVVLTDEAVAATLRERGFDVVETDVVDEACFAAAEIEDADSVLVATLDEQQNVLAVLTVVNVDPDVEVATFAREASDVPKLRAAGADTVVSLGPVIGGLVVEVALTDRTVDHVLEELTARN